MTINRLDSPSEYLSRLHDDGGSIADPSLVLSRKEDDFAQMGTVYTSEGDVPSTATVRSVGTFDNPIAAMEYLDNGGLVASTTAGEVIPMGFVYFYEYFDDLLQDWVWTIYIDEDTS